MKWIILAIILLIVFYVIGIYNSLVGKRNKVRNSWAQIDVQLKRRFDLIPNLVNTVKGYAAHEKDTLEKVVQARNKFMSATTPDEMMEANNELTQMLNRLMVVVERYPELKANANFMELQKELSNTEDKIGFARQFYNDTVMSYNTSIERFPNNIIANSFNFKQEPFFRAEEESRKAPTVSF
ncbi:MAG: LemA family protein [Xylanivirga thermophila]|jgi:LemA protein|uniref:LemA family protein n=1 Tax=Xylanivirga thermophila TaxID=2496273 RepID=UPI00101BE394|nr:LemA family protein [Xylanivirga thermophila]